MKTRGRLLDLAMKLVIDDLKGYSFSKREEIKPRLQELKRMWMLKSRGLDHLYKILKDSS